MAYVYAIGNEAALPPIGRGKPPLTSEPNEFLWTALCPAQETL